MRVSDIVRTDSELPTIEENANIFAVLDAMSRARAVACLILKPDGSLAGIFTHGDSPAVSGVTLC